MRVLTFALLLVCALAIRAPKRKENSLSPESLTQIKSSVDASAGQYTDGYLEVEEYSSVNTTNTTEPEFYNSTNTTVPIFNITQNSEGLPVINVEYDPAAQSYFDANFTPVVLSENQPNVSQGAITYYNLTSDSESESELDELAEFENSKNPAVASIAADANLRSQQLQNSSQETNASISGNTTINYTTATNLLDLDSTIMAETQVWTYSNDSEVDLDDYNPSNRSTEEFPDSIDEAGEPLNMGRTLYLLVTTFDSDRSTSGSVWVIPSFNTDDTEILIGGLSQPTGVCFDSNHNFLYVTDIESDGGYIYQYEIEWNSNGKFELLKDEYTVIYEGSEPYDCTIDVYGNLYFVDRVLDTVSIVNYLDLWAGFKNQNSVLYNSDSGVVSSPVAIDLVDSSLFYFGNNDPTATATTIVGAQTQVATINEAKTYTVETNVTGAVGLTASTDYVFFTGATGSLSVYDLSKDVVSNKSEGYLYAGVCYGDNKIYATDNANSEVVQLSADTSVEDGFTLLMISGPFGIHCVNWASLISLSLLGMFSLS